MNRLRPPRLSPANRFRRLLGVVLAGTAAGWTGVAAEPLPPRPNLLVILADDLGYGDVGVYNPAAKVATPNLDRLAAEGVRFTDAHSPSTVCTPSRYSLLTGRMCFRTGFRGVFTGVDGPLIEPGRLNLALFLKDQGYATACIGKWHVGLTFFQSNGVPVAARGGGLDKVRQVDWSRPFRDGPVDVGFDTFFGTACCPTTDWLYAYLRDDRVVEVPTEMVAPESDDWLDYDYFRTGLKSPGFEFREVDLVFLEKSREFLHQHRREHPERPFFLYHAMQAVHLPALPAERFVGRSGIGPLGDFLVECDAVVGELIRTLKELGLAENTLVIFTSDNGPEIVATRLLEEYGHASAGPWRGFKRDNWEGGHRVPFLASWPGRIPSGTVRTETLCLTDILATVAGLLQVPLPADAGEDSVDLSAVLLAKPNPGTVRTFTLHQTIRNSLGIRRGAWKFLDHPDSGGNNYGSRVLQPYRLPRGTPEAPGQLYHLGDDPGERHNRYWDRPDLVAELRHWLRLAQASPAALSPAGPTPGAQPVEHPE